jgi:hypothetical protein
MVAESAADTKLGSGEFVVAGLIPMLISNSFSAACLLSDIGEGDAPIMPVGTRLMPGDGIPPGSLIPAAT